MRIRLNNTSNNKDRWLLFIYILCLLLGIINSANENAVIGIAATLIICSCVLLFEMEHVFLLLMGTQFLVNVLPFSIGSSKLGFISFAFLCLIVKMAMSNTKFPIEIIGIFIILAIDIISSLIVNDLELAVIFNWGVSLFFLIIILKRYVNTINVNQLVLFFCLAEWAICIINVIAEYQLYGMSLQPSMYGHIRTEEGALTFGSAFSSVAGGNAIAINNALCIALCFLTFNRTKSLLHKLFYILTIVMFLYTGFMIISRVFYIEILLLVILILFSNYKKPLSFVLSILVICAIFIGIAYYFKTEHTDVFALVQARFNRGNSDRTDLWSNAISIISRNPRIMLFGAGSNYSEVFENATAHNILIDSVLSIGIVGASVYWFIIIKSIIRCIRKYRHDIGRRMSRSNLSSYIPLVMLIVFRLVSGCTRDIFFYFLISIVVIFAVNNERFLLRKEE